MIVKLTMIDKTEITVFNVYAIEVENFDLRLKQLGQNYAYTLNEFDREQIDHITILNV